MIRPRVILASASPRRRELLQLIGIEHEVRPSNIDEAYFPGELPRAHAERRGRRDNACHCRRVGPEVRADARRNVGRRGPGLWLRLDWC